MGRMICTEPQCLYKCALYLTNTSLLLWTVQSVQILSACTTVHFNFTYTSTLPMDRTDFIEPQFLHKGAFSFYCTSNNPMSRTASTETQCLYNGALKIYVYFYLPYRPFGLYRATVPELVCTLLLPITLHILWTVQPVQCLSTCTIMHLTLPMLYSPYAPFDLYRDTVPVYVYKLTLPIPLHILWTVQPEQKFRACTTAHFTFTITSNAPIYRTVCIEPQCRYKCAL